MGPIAVRDFSRTRMLVAAATLILSLALLLTAAAGARAAERIYWTNYASASEPMSFFDLGGGGGLLNAAGAEIVQAEGMVYDPVTRRFYVASSGGHGISYVNIDGSGGGILPLPPPVVGSPQGIVLDPASRTVYWLDAESGPEAIRWARLDGSAIGELPTGGAVLELAFRIALDPLRGRIYWGDGDGTISYANTDGSGGGSLNVTGTASSGNVSGLAVDDASGRLYWIDSNENIWFANLDGTGGGQLATPVGSMARPYGLAFDPGLGRLYWANGPGGPEGALGFADVSGGGGGLIDVAGAPVSEPGDPVVMKSPVATAAPRLSRSDHVLSCSQGSWAPDSPGSNFFEAPRSFAYQWTLNGVAIPGATSPSFTVSAPGSYACRVTATNELGSASQTSGTSTLKVTVRPVTRKAATVKPAPPKPPRPARLGLAVARRVLKARPGKLVKVPVWVTNRGGVNSSPTTACLRIPKQAKRALKPRKCRRLGAVAPGRTAKVALWVKVKKARAPRHKRRASHARSERRKPRTYKVRIVIRGMASTAVSLKVRG